MEQSIERINEQDVITWCMFVSFEAFEIVSNHKSITSNQLDEFIYTSRVGLI